MKLTLLPELSSPAALRSMSIEELETLAAEIRHVIVEQVRRSGGHLAPNLGVVELTIAMHAVFDLSHDRLLFDVGHQCYPHKLLTGRLPMLGKLRQRGGMSGFPEPRESDFDLFSVGHAGTGISTAVGMARGDDLGGQGWSPENEGGRRVATLIGDASIVNGVAMEGLNNAGTLKRQFLVVLNDNGMSIAKPQGAIAQYFDRVRLSHTYGGFKKAAKDFAARVPGGELMSDIYHRMGEMSKAVLAEDAWFERFGLVTVGPIDGHDLRTLIDYFNEAKHFDRPMVLHVKTVKGKGYGFAEGDACRFHSPGAFTVADDGDTGGEEKDLVSEGCRVEIKSSGRSYTAAFGDAMHELMTNDPRVVACTAAMPDGTGISKVMPDFPDRTWDTGICESHALDMMAGMAKTGWRPFFAVYSTFLQRAFDQAFQEVALQGLAVRLCLDRAGLVGGDGAVHHGFCDVSILSALPEAVLLAPADESSLRQGLAFMAGWDRSLSAIRYPRDGVPTSIEERFGAAPPFELGKARALVTHDEPHAAILAYGSSVADAVDALDRLSGEYAVNLYDARFAKPVDEDLLRDLIAREIPIVTIEDHSIRGGFGAQVLDAANTMRLDSSRITRLALPDSWIYQGGRGEQKEEAGIDAAAIASTIRRLLDSSPEASADAATDAAERARASHS